MFTNEISVGIILASEFVSHWFTFAISFIFDYDGSPFPRLFYSLFHSPFITFDDIRAFIKSIFSEYCVFRSHSSSGATHHANVYHQRISFFFHIHSFRSSLVSFNLIPPNGKHVAAPAQLVRIQQILCEYRCIYDIFLSIYVLFRMQKTKAAQPFEKYLRPTYTTNA